jgi:hypothetical protein
MMEYLIVLLAVVATFAATLASLWSIIAIWLTIDLVLEKLGK